MSAGLGRWIPSAVLAVLAVACVLVHLHVTGLRHRRLQQLANEVDLEQHALNGQDDLRQRVAAMQTEWMRIVPEDAADESHAADVLEQLTDDLNELGVRDRSLTSGTAQTSGLVRRTPLSVGFTSSFGTAFELFDRLAARDGTVRISRLVIRRDTQSAADGLTVAAQLEAIALSEDHVE